MRHAAVVVTLTTENSKPGDDNTSTSPSTSEDSKLGCTHKLVPLEDENDTNIVATYDPRGKYIYTGNSRGRIMIVLNEKASKFKTVTSFKVTQAASSTTAVKSIEFARRP